MKIRMTKSYMVYEVYDTIEINKEDYPDLEGLTDEEAVFRPILFNMFDRKDYSKHIWKLIKPKYEKL